MITLVTTIYEKDFEHILNFDGWFFNYSNDMITKKIVLINNIENMDKFTILKDKFEPYFDFYYTNQYLDEINKTFKLDIDESKKYYYYSVQHYCSIILAKSDFIFYVGADCKIFSDNLNDFFEKSMKILSNDNNIISTTFFWDELNLKSETMKHEESYINIRNDNFYLSKIFSDQVYFIKKNRMLLVDFTNDEILHPFPEYAIESFEFRLTNFLIKNNKYRGIIKNNSYYKHKSF